MEGPDPHRLAHNVHGEDADAVTALLRELSEALTEEYGVPPVQEETEEPVEPVEGSASGSGEGE